MGREDKYRLGKPVLNSGGLCSYRADCVTGQCRDAATWHILIINPDDLNACQSMATCDEHYDVAKGSAGIYFVQQHSYDVDCSMPGTVWNCIKNKCELEGFNPWVEIEANLKSSHYMSA